MLGTKLILHVVVSGLEGLRASAQNLLVFKKKKKTNIYGCIWHWEHKSLEVASCGNSLPKNLYKINQITIFILVKNLNLILIFIHCTIKLNELFCFEINHTKSMFLGKYDIFLVNHIKSPTKLKYALKSRGFTMIFLAQ